MKGICHDCKVRKNDTTEKEVTKCLLCEEDYCDYHLEPKLVVLTKDDYKDMIKDGKLLTLMEAEWKRSDGHPCMPYTHYKWSEMDLETKRLYEAFDRWIESLKKKKHANLRKALYAIFPIAIIIIFIFLLRR